MTEYPKWQLKDVQMTTPSEAAPLAPLETDRCYYCGRSGREGHHPDCLYMQAKAAEKTKAKEKVMRDAPKYRPEEEVNPVPEGPKATRLPTGSEDRKNFPIYSGLMAYFPDALAYVANISKYGNDKHNPGQPLHWSRAKSNDHLDCIARHLLEVGTNDGPFLHDGMLAWRALANLQIVLEKLKGVPISPGSK